MGLPSKFKNPPCITGERWMVPLGFSKYLVSSNGKIWSMTRGLLLKQKRDRDGYLRVDMTPDGGDDKKVAAHHIVLFGFHGKRPSGTQTRHLDGNKQNNSSKNLAWGTKEENAKDRHRLGEIPRGGTHGRAKLTERDVLNIRRLKATGSKIVDLASEYGVAPSTISMAVSGRNWNHLSEPLLAAVAGAEDSTVKHRRGDK